MKLKDCQPKVFKVFKVFIKLNTHQKNLVDKHNGSISIKIFYGFNNKNLFFIFST